MNQLNETAFIRGAERRIRKPGTHENVFRESSSIANPQND